MTVAHIIKIIYQPHNDNNYVKNLILYAALIKLQSLALFRAELKVINYQNTFLNTDWFAILA